MTPSIIVQGSSLKYAELPPKRSIHNPDKPTKEYQEAIESAIEVHPESVETAKYLIVNSNQQTFLDGINDGVYPIEAKVRIVLETDIEWIKCPCSCHKYSGLKHIEPCCVDGKIQIPNMKKYAILEPENSAHSFTEGSETVYSHTGMVTPCDGRIGSNGVCNKCFHIVQTSSSYCGRLVPVLDMESKVLPDQLPKEFLIAYSGMTEEKIKRQYDKWLKNKEL